MEKIDLPEYNYLTPAEARVLRLVFKGQTALQASYTLSLSRATILGHLYRAYRKLNVHDVEQARKRLKELGCWSA